MSLLHRSRTDTDVESDRDVDYRDVEHRRDAAVAADPDGRYVATTGEHGPGFEHDPVIDRDAAPVIDRKVRERRVDFAPGQLVSLVGGLMLTAVGLIAIIRAGLDTPLDTPVVSVMGWDHTAWLGVAEVGAGLLLVLAGVSAAAGRPVSVLVGSLLVVGGILVLAEEQARPVELGIERSFGWPLVAFGAVVALAALVLPAWRTRSVEEIDIRS
jgi:hypothetical protein